MAEHERNEQPTDADAQQPADQTDADAQELPTADDATQPGGDAPQPGDEAPSDDAPSPAEAGSTAERPDEDDPSAEAMAEDALDEVEQAARHLSDEAEQGVVQSMDLPEFARSTNGAAQVAQSMGLLSDVSMNVTIELGRTRMYVEDVLKLNANSIVELDKAAGDPVDIYVNDCHVARGEVLVLNENFCVRVSEIVASPPRAESED